MLASPSKILGGGGGLASFVPMHMCYCILYQQVHEEGFYFKNSHKMDVFLGLF